MQKFHFKSYWVLKDRIETFFRRVKFNLHFIHLKMWYGGLRNIPEAKMAELFGPIDFPTRELNKITTALYALGTAINKEPKDWSLHQDIVSSVGNYETIAQYTLLTDIEQSNDMRTALFRELLSRGDISDVTRRFYSKQIFRWLTYKG